MNRLAELVRELEKEISEWKAKPSPVEEHERMVEAVKTFCFTCPLLDGAECVLCHLHEWRNGEVLK